MILRHKDIIKIIVEGSKQQLHAMNKNKKRIHVFRHHTCLPFVEFEKHFVNYYNKFQLLEKINKPANN